MAGGSVETPDGDFRCSVVPADCELMRRSGVGDVVHDVGTSTHCITQSEVDVVDRARDVAPAGLPASEVRLTVNRLAGFLPRFNLSAACVCTLAELLHGSLCHHWEFDLSVSPERLRLKH